MQFKRNVDRISACRSNLHLHSKKLRCGIPAVVIHVTTKTYVRLQLIRFNTPKINRFASYYLHRFATNKIMAEMSAI